MSPNHHPQQELIAAYASGGLREPVALVVATHLAYCLQCRHEAEEYEALGGILLEDLPLEPIPGGMAREIVAMPALPTSASPQPARPEQAKEGLHLPEPLRSYVHGDLGSLQWRWRGNLREARLLKDYPGFVTRVLRIRSGAPVPRHTHGGEEMTLILSGGYRDEFGEYLQGDLAMADASIDHRPVANAGGDCWCLAVVDAPLRLTGLGGRLFNFLLNH